MGTVARMSVTTFTIAFGAVDAASQMVGRVQPGTDSSRGPSLQCDSRQHWFSAASRAGVLWRQSQAVMRHTEALPSESMSSSPSVGTWVRRASQRRGAAPVAEPEAVASELL